MESWQWRRVKAQTSQSQPDQDFPFNSSLLHHLSLSTSLLTLPLFLPLPLSFCVLFFCGLQPPSKTPSTCDWLYVSLTCSQQDRVSDDGWSPKLCHSHLSLTTPTPFPTTTTTTTSTTPPPPLVFATRHPQTPTCMLCCAPECVESHVVVMLFVVYLFF